MRKTNRWMRMLAGLVSLAMLLCGAGAALAVEEGTLRTAILHDITTMDVAETTDDYMIPMNVFERLFETRKSGTEAVVEKSLCTDFTVSEDGLRYDFTLPEGVIFSNGSALTASDVQYSFERLLKKAKQNTDIPLEVVGGEAVMNGEADTLAGFEVQDDTHFSITLTAPNVGFTAELSAPAMSIVDRETTENAAAFGQDPADTIGSGPYKVTEWVSNDHYTLVYNDKYRGPEPSVKRVEVRVIPDAGTQSLLFANGDLDLLDLANLDSQLVKVSYKDNPQYQDRIVSTPKAGLTFIVLNENQKYLQDVRVRKAIGMAIDVEEIIDGIYSGDATQENGIIPAGVWAHNPDLTGFTYDPDGARALLKEAGYADGEVTFELSMDTTANTSIQLVYQTVSMRLMDVGINAVIQPYDHAAFLEKRMAGGMDSFIGRWGMDYNDPANIMATFFGGKTQTAQRSLNYPDEEILNRVAAASAIVDDDTRKAEYQALEQKIIGEDVAWIPLVEEQHLYCLGDRVAAFIPQWAGFTDFYATDVTLK